MISMVGCGGGPEEAAEAEALEGMDDMASFDEISDLPGDGVGPEDAEGSAASDEGAAP